MIAPAPAPVIAPEPERPSILPPAPHYATMEELRARDRVRREREAAEARATELEHRRAIAAHRLARATQPETVSTATMPRRGSTSGPRSRGRARNVANALAHQVYTTEQAREARKRYGDLQQAVAHLEAETKKAKEKVQALRQVEKDMGAEEAAATHRVPCAPTVDGVIKAALSASA